MLDATFENEGGGCRISHINMVVQSATLLYGAVFDLAMMILIIYKSPMRGSPAVILHKLLLHPNLIYIFVAFIFNCSATIFIRLNLNAVMASIFVFPSAVCSTINATRCVRRQVNYRARMEEDSLPLPISTVRFRKETCTDNPASAPAQSGFDQIQMQTFDPKGNTIDVASETTYQGSDGSMDKSGYESSTTNVGSAH